MSLEYGRVQFTDPHFRPAPIVPAIPMPRKPHTCPICHGRGTVPHDFYTGTKLAGVTEGVKCRACDGRGVIIA